jgi:hypothetical protein
MSISYEGVLVVGVLFGNCSAEEKELLNELISTDEIQDYPPKFDYYRYGVVGICVGSSGDYSAQEINIDTLAEKCRKAKETFLKATGIEGKVYLSPYSS